MNKRHFNILGGITAVALTGAVFVSLNDPDTAAYDIVGTPAFPELRADSSKVSEVKITTDDQTFTLVKTGDQWIAPDRGNYRADQSKVTELLGSLTSMKLAEAKTSNPKLYARLEVEDIGPDANSKLIELSNEDGSEIAGLYLGKRKFSLVGDERQGTYIRLKDDPQTWLVTGGLNVNDQITNWLDKKLVDIAESEVRSIKVNPLEGETYSIARQEEEEPFEMSGLIDQELADEAETFATLSNALSGLNFVDVARQEDLVMPLKANATTFETFDGLKISTRLASVDEDHWATFSVDYSGSDEEAKKTADELSQRFSGWVYKVRENTFNNLTKAKEEWLKKDKESTS